MSTVEYTSPGERLARSSLVALIQVQVARIAALPLGVDASAELAELERLQDELYGDQIPRRAVADSRRGA